MKGSKLKYLTQKRAVSDIVYAYRQLQGRKGVACSLRDFTKYLNQMLKEEEFDIVHQTVKNWEDRKTLPGMFLLHVLRSTATDWRRDFAQDLLAALRPDKYHPATAIGLLALKRSQIETGPHKRRYGSWWSE